MKNNFVAVSLCFYVNKHPGATNTHPTSCGKWVLFGVNIAISPFLAQVGMDLQNHLLFGNPGHGHRWKKISTWAAWKEHGREERITQSWFCSIFIPLVADLPWGLLGSSSFLLSLCPIHAPGQRDDKKQLQEGRNICSDKILYSSAQSSLAMPLQWLQLPKLHKGSSAQNKNAHAGGYSSKGEIQQNFGFISFITKPRGWGRTIFGGFEQCRLFSVTHRGFSPHQCLF